ncbi:unnamed protein product, partial [Iphiclides podalirius]
MKRSDDCRLVCSEVKSRVVLKFPHSAPLPHRTVLLDRAGKISRAPTGCEGTGAKIGELHANSLEPAVRLWIIHEGRAEALVGRSLMARNNTFRDPHRESPLESPYLASDKPLAFKTVPPNTLQCSIHWFAIDTMGIFEKAEVLPAANGHLRSRISFGQHQKLDRAYAPKRAPTLDSSVRKSAERVSRQARRNRATNVDTAPLTGHRWRVAGRHVTDHGLSEIDTRHVTGSLSRAPPPLSRGRTGDAPS